MRRFTVKLINTFLFAVFFWLPENCFSNDRGQKVDTNSLEKKYWSKSKEDSVIENRQFTKSSKFGLSLLGGMQYVDPFLNAMQFGGSVSYFFSEHWGISLLGWNSKTTPSSAQTQLELTGKKAETDDPKLLIAAEAIWAPFYGKLSVMGWKFIAYDLTFSAGIGQTTTLYNSSFGPLLGIGQRFHLHENISIGIDYRKGYYQEVALNRAKRANYPDYIFGGVHFLF